MKIVLLTHYYAPELGAPQTRLRETARALVGLGHEVRVVTGPPHYPDGRVRPGYAAWRVSREEIDGIRVLRLPMWPRRNGGFVDRTIDQGTFAAAALVAVGPIRWGDVTLVESPPLFLGLTAALQARFLDRPFVFHVADPWPDFPIEMGALTNPAARRIAYGIEATAYRHATFVTTVTPGLVALLDRKPEAHGKVRLAANGVDTARFHPERDPVAARAELGWPEAALTLVYAGSVGRAQGLATLLDAAAPLGPDGVLIHVVGEGYERDALATEARRRGLDHVRFEPPLPASRIPDVLAAADGILVMLRAGHLYEHSLPTKLVEGLAAGRPLIVSAAGEAAQIVAQAGAGVHAAPEDPEALRAAIQSLRLTARRSEMGDAARRLAETAYDRRVLTARLADLLSEAASGRR